MQTYKMYNASIFSAALLGESLQLTPSPQLGQFYMVPYENNKMVTESCKTGRETKVKVNEAQFQIDIKDISSLPLEADNIEK